MNYVARLLVAASLVTVAACTQSVGDSEPVESSDHAIIGGVESQPGAWPGTVALYIGGGQACGGALVGDSWVLTAGHCVNPSSATGGITKVVINRHKLSSSEGETRTVDRAIRHQGYANLDNDLALLHLSTPSTAPKAKLLSSSQVTTAVAADDSVTVVGWGNTREGGAQSDVLREVAVPVIANTQCKSMPRYERVTDNMICAGLVAGSKDSCQGDSGGPLFQKIEDQWVEVGLVSWGIGCARPNAPGVYTRLGNYLGWMFEKTNGEVGEAPAPVPGPGPVTPPATN
jgi:secreted trypsin-like serine protease